MISDPPTAIGVILNPRAGRGRAMRLLPTIVERLHRGSAEHMIHVTSRPGEAIDVARAMAEDGRTRVIAVGGDGIINEVANGLLAAGREAALGVVPVSRGSDFARTLGIPANVHAALRLALTGPVRTVDAGIATFDDGATRSFVNIAGVGFDAVVADRANRSRIPGSTLPYLSAIVGSLAGLKGLDATLIYGQAREDRRAYAVLVANGRSFGGGMRIVPRASLSDGRLDLAVLGDAGRLELLRTLPKVFWGGHVDHPAFHHTPIKQIRIETAEPALVELDGEVCGRTPVSFRVLPGALRVVG